MEDELLRWCDAEGLVRYAAFAEPDGAVAEVARGPLVALGPRDDDFRVAPAPEGQGYRLKRLAEMALDDYQAFILSWYEHAIRAGDVRCASCGRPILETTPDMADADTWDAIFVEKELVAWMVVHFDCKKALARQLRGRHPFELEPRPAPVYDLSDEIYGAPTQSNAEDAEGTEDAEENMDAHG